MNKDKIIKDLKERNDKLANQYRLRDIRCIHLEKENEILQQENKQLKEDFVVLKKLQMISNDILNELEEWLKEKINYIVNYIDKSKVKPYGEELENTENCANRYNDVLDKIQELKEKYK